MKLEVPNLHNLIARYRAGCSMLQLSKESGITRPVLTRRFRERGIPIRGRSDAERLKWSVLKRDRRLIERQLAKAWQASRGRSMPLAEKIQRAQTMATRFLHLGRHETAVLNALTDTGLQATPQCPVGPYNLDLGLREARIAVEIQTAYLSGGKSTRPQRIEYLLDRGWAVLILYLPRSAGPYDYRALAQHVLAFTNQVRRHPAAPRGYGMIRGDGQPITTRRPQFYGRPRVLGF